MTPQALAERLNAVLLGNCVAKEPYLTSYEIEAIDQAARLLAGMGEPFCWFRAYTPDGEPIEDFSIGKERPSDWPNGLGSLSDGTPLFAPQEGV